MTGLGQRELHVRLRLVEKDGAGQAGGPHGRPVQRGLVEDRLPARRDRRGEREVLIAGHRPSLQDDPVEDLILAHRRQHREDRGRQVEVKLVVLGKKPLRQGEGRGGKDRILRGLGGAIGGDADRQEQRHRGEGRGREELPDELALQRSAKADRRKAARQGSGAARRIGHGSVRR